MKIAFFEIDDWEIPIIEKKLKGQSADYYKDCLTEENVEKYQDVEVLCVFIYSSLTAKVLEKLPKLKLITTRSMGFDHIDLNYCKKKGITVCTVPTYGANTVAEHAFALLLAISRNIIPSIEQTRRGNFDVEGLRGFDLHKKTLGVIGIGHIGKEVIRIAHGFGMHVIAYTHHPSEEMARSLHVTFHNLNELLSLSDVITLHLPLSKDTHHLLNKRNVGKCKKGSVLINTARGGLIETEAIVYALGKGIFKAVGLDVLEEEIGIKEERELLHTKFMHKTDLQTQLYDHVLLERDNVLITPHNAFNSDEALDTILQVTCDNIFGFFNQEPINTVL